VFFFIKFAHRTDGASVQIVNGTSRGEYAMTQETWTTNRVDTLKSCFEAGMSMREIAVRIGVSRNAVIGKVNRLKLKRIKVRSRSVDERRPRLRRRLLKSPPIASTIIEQTPTTEPIALEENFVIPQSKRVSLFELTEAICHWPIGTPGTDDFCFCGGHALTGLPYCARHSRLAYMPAADRRRPSGVSHH